MYLWGTDVPTNPITLFDKCPACGWSLLIDLAKVRRCVHCSHETPLPERRGKLVRTCSASVVSGSVDVDSSGIVEDPR